MALSIALELPVALALGWSRVGPPGLVDGAPMPTRAPERWRLVLVAVAATLVTHPFAWGGNEALAGHLSVVPRLAIVEIAVATVEGALYARIAGLGWPRGLAAGFLANAWSFGFGLWWFW